MHEEREALMLGVEKIGIDKPQGHGCFACGTANPIGLNLHFYRAGDAVCSDVTLGRYHEGWENMAHGGIISALLDEVMSWAILYFKKTFAVTRKMEVKYVKPVLIGTPLTVAGRLLDGYEILKIRTQGEIRDQEGRLLVRSNAEFVALSKEELTAVPDQMKQQMLALFEKFE